ncbi:MAG: hypothetical protein JO089_05835, partial [Alphaproteobacteria bacterium]|nr:hypothetical protein [Alphaproteobacteria bacterium]
MADSVNTQDAQDTQNTLKTSDTVDIIARIEKPVSLGRRMWNTISGAFLGGVATGAAGAVAGAGIGAVTGYALSDQIKSGLQQTNDNLGQVLTGLKGWTPDATQYIDELTQNKQVLTDTIKAMTPGGTAAYGAAAGAA